jgi:hypothetical protein
MSETVSSEELVVTLELLQAAASAQAALRTRAVELKLLPEYAEFNFVGQILRERSERDLQRADLLRGWCERMRTAKKIPESEVRYV